MRNLNYWETKLKELHLTMENGRSGLIYVDPFILDELYYGYIYKKKYGKKLGGLKNIERYYQGN